MKKIYYFVCGYSIAGALPLFLWVYPNFWEWMASGTSEIGGRTIGAFLFSVSVLSALYLIGRIMSEQAPDDIFDLNEIQSLAHAKQALADAESALRFERKRTR